MMRTKIISLFNHKGGVSKTTTTFHLGWMLAILGKRVMIVDTDPQCNLTGMCISNTHNVEIEELYQSGVSNIRSILSPVLDGRPEPLSAANCYTFREIPNLFLLPGHIAFSEYDATYNIAENLTGSLAVFQNVPGALRYMLEITAEKYKLDYILLDMSPSISATNANILMQSDYFFIPCAPDYFCYMAIESLSDTFPKWRQAYQKMAQLDAFKKATYKMKTTPPTFIGTIQQRYRPRNGLPAKAFAEWIDNINRLVCESMVPSLKACGMCVAEEKTECFLEPYNLANISDFNSLIAQAQEHRVPVFLLTKEQVGKTGRVWDNMEKSRDEFHSTFKTLAKRIVQITE